MESYTKTDQYIHQLSQLLAKMGKSLVPAKGDYSHANLYWDSLRKLLLGRWISASEGLFI
jgi:hypothetical protein